MSRTLTGKSPDHRRFGPGNAINDSLQGGISLRARKKHKPWEQGGKALVEVVRGRLFHAYRSIWTRLANGSQRAERQSRTPDAASVAYCCFRGGPG